jgi:hypothetical protein
MAATLSEDPNQYKESDSLPGMGQTALGDSRMASAAAP